MPQAGDFLSRLPLELTLNDYNNTTEKISYPNPPLKTEGVNAVLSAKVESMVVLGMHTLFPDFGHRQSPVKCSARCIRPD